MNVNNPVDLAPVLGQLQQALTNLNAVSQQVTTENAAITQELQTQTGEIDAVLESLTTVNGELDNTATAVNQHTSDELAATQTALQEHVTQEFGVHSVIKSIQRGTTHVLNNTSLTVPLGSIDIDKSVLSVFPLTSKLPEETDPSVNPSGINIQSSGGLAEIYIGRAGNVSGGTFVSWEVIEYA